MVDPYSGREQTRAKHFILKMYLQELAFKLLKHWDLAYVDGFSGPWETKTDNFHDTSFMIAIDVLQDAQNKVHEIHGVRPTVRCFFSEVNVSSFAKLELAVAPFNNPQLGFEIKTYNGQFEDAVREIDQFIGTSFPLIFIDPTGWKGYPLEKIKILFDHPKCEVIVNFMYDFINRAAHIEDPKVVNTLAPILGGSDWPQRLDPNLSRGLAVEKLFRDTLKSVGNFVHVISTKIDRTTSERPLYFLAYATKDVAGLKVFRNIEYRALRQYAKGRASAKYQKRELKSGSQDLFSTHEAELQEASIDMIVMQQMEIAKDTLTERLESHNVIPFRKVVAELLEAFMLRETNIKDLCIELAKNGVILNTWGRGNRKPNDQTIIKRAPRTI